MTPDTAVYFGASWVVPTVIAIMVAGTHSASDSYGARHDWASTTVGVAGITMFSAFLTTVLLVGIFSKQWLRGGISAASRRATGAAVDGVRSCTHWFLSWRGLAVTGLSIWGIFAFGWWLVFVGPLCVVIFRWWRNL